MSTFAMNVVAPDSPVPFTPLGGEVIYWLNPNGTVTIDGTWESLLLPNGVVDTGMRGGLNEAGDIILYRPDVDGYYNTNLTELNPNTGLPYASGETRSEMGPMDFVRASVDGYLTALEQFAAKANASLPDASKINIDVFKRLTLLTKAGPLAVVDAMVNYQSDGASGLAKFALGTAAGFLAGAIATGALAGAPALAMGGAVILMGVGAAYATNLVWDAMNGHERFDQLTTWLDTQMVDGGDALQAFYNDAADWFGDKWDSLKDGMSDFLANLKQEMLDIGSMPDTTPGSFESMILDKLLNLSNSLSKLQSLFGFDAPGSLTDNINSLFNMIDRAANPPRDPLVFDLNGNGVETVGTDAGILFDHNGDGIKFGTGWVAPSDGLLVWDRNGNGVIDSGLELFGDNHRIFVGSSYERNARDGFEALRFYDRNENDLNQRPDGVIDHNDAIFTELQIWRDLNQDGISQADELFSLAELGITSINLDNQRADNTQNGNIIDSVSTFEWADGRTGEVSSLFFAANHFRNSFTDAIPLTERTEILPDFIGSGGLRSLREVATLDNALADLIEQFATVTTRAEQNTLIDDILWQWHLSSQTTTRYQDHINWGGYLGGSEMLGLVVYQVNKGELAGKTSVVEAFNGSLLTSLEHNVILPNYHVRHFMPTMVVQENSWLHRIQNNTIAAIETAYEQLRQQVYLSLTFQTRLKPITDAIDVTFGADGLVVDFSEMELKLTELVQQNPVDGMADLFDFVSQYSAVLFANGWNAGEFISQLESGVLALLDPEHSWKELVTNGVIKDLIAGEQQFNGGNAGVEILRGNDHGVTLRGNGGVDILIGGDGNDSLYGGDGNDLLIGGAGSDQLTGGGGSDTYRFSRGWGQDSINNYDTGIDKTDAIVFAEGIAPADILVTRSGNNLVLTLSGSEDRITVSNYFQNDGASAYKLEEVRFANGTVWDIAQVKLAVLQGTEGSDTIRGYATDDVLNGGAGNDFLYGGAGNDVLYGGDGNDHLYGEAGDDRLYGDAGDDYLFGGAGNDELHGGDGNDLLYGEDGDDRLYGDAGNDRLYGGTGNDLLDGGAGNDQLYGGAGNDTYLFGRGDGQDTIHNHDAADYANANSHDRLVFKDGVALEDIEYFRSGANLVFRIAGSTDTVTVSNWFNSTGSYKLQSVEFADGRSLDLAQVELDVRTLHGDADDNTLSGAETDDVLYGYGGNDQLFGRAGDDILIGGIGDDYLEGGAGSDTYRFARGWGQDTVNNYDTTAVKTDVIEFADDITQADIQISRSGDNLILSLIGGTDRITVQNYFMDDGNSHYKLEEVHFADGTVWDIAAIKSIQLIGTSGDDVIVGYDTDDIIVIGQGQDYVAGNLGNDTYQISADHGNIVIEEGQINASARRDRNMRVLGWNGKNDILVGGTGDDTLEGMSGDDILNGSRGNDLLIGGAGSDIYRFDRGWGNDRIDNYDTGTNKTDAIEFAAGIKPDDIRAKQVGNDLMLMRVGSPDTINVTNYFLNDGDSAYKLEEIRFADSTVWLYADVKQAAATYDDSSDGSLDRIVFSELNPADVMLRRAAPANFYSSPGNDLIITNLQTGATITVKDQFHHHGHKTIEEIEFADGTVWDIAAINQQLLIGTELADTIHGTADADVIYGHAGDDVLYGHAGDDKLYGGAGDDVLYGGSGDDELHGGDGNDRLYGGAGDDVIYGGAGDDVIEDSDGNNQLFGEDGNDHIIGTGLLDGGAGDDVLEGRGSDILRGGDGNDTLIAYSDTWTRNSNILEGGKGNDTIYGGFGDDTYIFNLGDGEDLIIERRQGQAYSNVAASFDTLQFGEGIVADDLMFMRTGNDLLIRHSNGSDSITVQNWFAGSTHYKLNLLTFTDGSELNVAQIESMLVTMGTAGNDTLFGSVNQDNVIYGEAGNDYIDGRGGNNRLYGGDGNDTLVSGTGNDLLVGGAGDDSYVYKPGSGMDTIDNRGGGYDGLFFTNGIDISRLSFSQDGDDLVILVDGDESQSVRVLNHFLGGDAALSFVQPSGSNMLSAAQIAAIIAAGDEEEPEPVDPTEPAPTDPVDPTDPDDGEPEPGDTVTPGLGGDDQLTGTAGNDVLLAGAGDDVLSGLAGNDRLFGGTGNDTYIYHSGQDVITEEGGTDKVIFSNGITFNQVASGLMKSGNDLVLRVNGSTANSVTLVNFFLGGDYLVESFEFETGGSISAAQIFGAFGLAMPTGDAPSANVINGTAGNDVLTGTAGADVLKGSHGNDTLNGGTGNDLLLGGRGNDTYIFSAGGGHDTIDNTGGGEDELVFEGISFNQVASGLMKSGNDLVLNIAGGSDKVTIKNWFLGGDFVIPTLRFASGGQISANQIFGAFGLANPNPVQSLAYPSLPDEQAFATVYTGTSAAETIIGSSGDDFIDGGDGNDVLRGGAGNDYLLGGRGNDTYLFGKADGHNIVNNYDPTAGRTDVLRFDADVSPQDVSAERSGDNLLLRTTADSSITVLNYFAEDGNSAYRLNQIQFADGTVWDFTAVNGLIADAAVSNSTNNMMLASTNFFATDAVGNQNVGGESITVAEPLSATAYKVFRRQQRGKRYGQIQEFERLDQLHDKLSTIETIEPVTSMNEIATLQATVMAEVTAEVTASVWPTLEQSMLLFSEQSKAERFAEVLEFEQVDRPHDALDAEVAKLIDAVNAFDVADAAELDGNIAVVPELAYHYY